MTYGDARRTRLRREDFGFVFQSGQLLPELPAAENATRPLLLGGTEPRTATARAREVLAALGLSGMEGRRPGQLSGGQAQRVAIVRALVGSPSVVFADEPTGALDQGTGHEVLDLLTVAGGVQAFAARAGAVRSAGSTGVYPLLSRVSVVLLLVPTATLGAPAARLTITRRDERLSRLRLAGATSGQVGVVALLDAALQALAGALAGVVLHVLATPAIARLAPWVLAATAAAVLTVALVSCAVSLRRVVITPSVSRSACRARG